jgi:hypothetical protein
MMGQRSANRERLFYSFNLDEHVPADHLLRAIDASRLHDVRGDISADLSSHRGPHSRGRAEVESSPDSRIGDLGR